VLQERVAELRSLLQQAAHAYYVKDAPLMRDAVYDQLFRELQELERSYPELISPDSPTQRVGGEPVEGFRSVAHRVPLYSLKNAFNLAELEAWYDRLVKVLNSVPMVAGPALAMVGELKIDGNALALSYEHGLLVRAATRGDGERGEEITANVRTIASVPLRLHLEQPPAWVEVRGEALIPDESFATINAERQARGESLFANPRNACAGTLRQLDSRVVAARRLSFFAYTLHLPDDGQGNPGKPATQWSSLEWLESAGFQVNPYRERFSDLAGVESFFNRWEGDRKALPYATDGVVVKLDDLKLQEIAGFTDTHPRWAVALKYPAEEAPSRLLRIICQVGRTGAVTPVAEFEPVHLAGTIVSRASLHNANRVAELDLHSGDSIVVRKAGEIIPEVVGVLPELRKLEAISLVLPDCCPECGSRLVREEGETATRCINSSCPAILLASLCHWVSKKAVDIDGLGTKSIEQMVESGLVKSIADLYRIEVSVLASLERMGEKSANNVVDELSKSKAKPWHRKLYGLGINHIGEVNAKALSRAYPSAELLKQASIQNTDEITRLAGFGPEMSRSLQQWFSNAANQHLIDELMSMGVEMGSGEEDIARQLAVDSITIKNSLDGKKFVLTGKLPSLSRAEAQSLIEAAGGKVIDSVSKQTDYVVAGDKAGTKLDKAVALGVSVLSETDLHELLKIEINRRQLTSFIE
jgi:DNA ligase (NAD+)